MGAIGIEGRMQDHTFTLIVTGVGIGGTLGGIAIGHFLTRSWQQKQWLIDNRKEECRELLTAMSEFIRIAALVRPLQPLDPEQEKEFEQTNSATFRTIRDRIFIAREITGLKIAERWSDAIGNHARTLDVAILGLAFEQIRGEILRIALNASPKRG